MVDRGRRAARAGDAALLAGLTVVAYTYIGYPILLQLGTRRRHRPVPPTPIALPTMTVVVPAYQEEAVIGPKLDDLFSKPEEPKRSLDDLLG